MSTSLQDLLHTLVSCLHVFVCAVLMFVVLLQQGKGGGMGAALGGGGAAQVFGGRGAGNILTRATAICAGLFMVTSMTLAYQSSAKDRALVARQAQEDQHHATKATAKPKDAPKVDDKGAGATPPSSPTPATAATPAGESPAPSPAP